jgi:hydrogenase maturation protease
VVKPVLVFAYGNLSRGDDALGPLLLEYLESHANLEQIELLTDFQLQVEHALDLGNRQLVLFVDASVACLNDFAFELLVPARDKSYTTHAMSPASVLAVYQTINKKSPPKSFLLSIKGVEFELGGALSEHAGKNLIKACEFALQLLNNPRLDFWQQQLEPTLASFLLPLESA